MRSLLFIPGDSPKKLEKGLGAGADALLLDLEDSIAPPNKAAARATTAQAETGQVNLAAFHPILAGDIIQERHQRTVIPAALGLGRDQDKREVRMGQHELGRPMPLQSGCGHKMISVSLRQWWKARHRD